MTTLYRKYRPQRFADLVGQDDIRQTLTNELLLNRLGHAYLFSGPRGTGKTSTARLFAKAINCQNRAKDSFEPCNTCTSCQEITAQRSVDVIEIDAASHTGVDNVREHIIDNAQFKPTRSPYKIFIIDEVHMLSTSAFNALLKTLEEPPAHALFILATTELHKLPATILSRCQRFTFKKIKPGAIKERLHKLIAEEGVKVEDAVLDRLIIKCEGGLRDAESMLGQILTLAHDGAVTTADVETVLPPLTTEAVLTFIEHVGKKTPEAAISYLAGLVTNGLNIDYFAVQLIDIARTILTAKITKETKNWNGTFDEETIARLEKALELFTVDEVLLLVDRLLERRLQIKTSPIPELPLELLAVEYVQRPKIQLQTLPSTGAARPTPQTVPGTKPAEKPFTGPATPISTPSAPTATSSPSTPTSTIPPTASTDTGPSTATLEAIQRDWKEIVKTIGLESPSLTFILNMAAPKELSGPSFTLNVAYAFHAEKLNETKNKKLIESVLEQRYGGRFHFSAEHVPGTSKAPTEHVSPGLNAEDLAAAFGGAVVS